MVNLCVAAHSNSVNVQQLMMSLPVIDQVGLSHEDDVQAGRLDAFRDVTSWPARLQPLNLMCEHAQLMMIEPTKHLKRPTMITTSHHPKIRIIA